MSAYAALFSLMNTIHHILHSSRLRLDPPSLEIMQVVYEELQPWDKILERLDESRKSKSRKKVNAVDGRIKDILWNFEDLLESLLSHQIIPQIESSQDQLEWRRRRRRRRRIKLQPKAEGEESHLSRRKFYILKEKSDASSQSRSSEGGVERDVLMLFSIDLRSLQDDADSFIQTLKSMEKEYIYEVDNMPQDEDEDEYKSCVSSSISSDVDESCISSSTRAGTFVETKSKMIGLSDQFEQFKSYLMRDAFSRKISGFGLTGMAGVGKTRLAREIYEDPQINSHFDFRLWITVGRKSSARLINQLEVSQSILGELKGGEKCLIVVDDVWEQTQELSSLFTSIVEMKNKIIRILLTTRDGNVIEYVRHYLSYIDPKVVRFLNEEESKDLLCHKVFGENIICPPQLDKAATKIAKKCEGLPLTIVTVADLLAKAQNRDPQYWEDVAEERNSIFTDAYNQMSKVLYPTYEYFDQYLKMFFLFLGVFPRDYEIPLSKIINMLIAESWFPDPNNQDSGYVGITKCLDHLRTSHNLLLWKRNRIWWTITDIKTCRLHSAWRQLCRGEARKNKFYHVLNRIADAEEASIIQGQRCLCLENNLLFAITEFCNSVRSSNCASTTRSLLFFGPYQQYPTPIDAIGFKLLRELNALQLRFYTFPMQILTLVQLKYLALTCNGDLPSTISKLFNLKVLIIHPHMSITKCCDTARPSSYGSYIPIEIWDIAELEHIEILGKSFQPPPNDRVANSLETVSTVVGVNAGSICTIAQRIPKVRKLAVQMELTPYDSSDLILSCFPHILTLGSLKTLKCSVINPVLKYRNVAPSSSCPSSPRSLMFPHGLRKLHLSGMGFPWEYMDAIGSLPRLEVLKLRSYAFRGSKWEARGGSFLRLWCLVIEDSDLVEWKPASRSFIKLSYLSLKHCYNLKELHWPSETLFGGTIELVDCNPLGVSCANKLPGQKGNKFLSVTASDDFEA